MNRINYKRFTKALSANNAEARQNVVSYQKYSTFLVMLKHLNLQQLNPIIMDVKPAVFSTLSNGDSDMTRISQNVINHHLSLFYKPEATDKSSLLHADLCYCLLRK